MAINFRKFFCKVFNGWNWFYRKADCRRYEKKVLVETCTVSGKFPNVFCKSVVPVYYYEDELPLPICDVCEEEIETVIVPVCLLSGLLPNEFCEDIVDGVFEKGKEPTEVCNLCKEKYTVVEHPLFGVSGIDYMIGYVPWDAHALNIPFTENFTREDWVEGCELMAKNGVNAVRFFLACGEKKDDINNYILPFKKIGNNYVNLFNYDHDDMVEYEWRLNEFWKRGIATVLCVCTGIKENRFSNTVWHGDRNNGYPEDVDGKIVRRKLTTNCREFLIDGYTKLAVRKVTINLYKRWKNKPVIFEDINEPEGFGNTEKVNWHRYMLRGLKSNGCPKKKMGFEKWDSGLVLDLLSEFDCWCWNHGVNNLDWFVRFHQSGCELQKYFFDKFVYFAQDADGHIKDYPGRGLVGYKWDEDFKRACPVDMRNGLIYDANHNGGGWIIWSAGAWYNKNVSGKPNYKDWKYVAIDGLTREECEHWNVKWEDFSSIGLNAIRKPLGELKAIKDAVNVMFK